MQRKSHWDTIYSTKSSTDVSWYQPRPELSLKLITGTGIDRSAHIIDSGSGRSDLVDHLLDLGYDHITCLDVSGEAIRQAQARLGERSAAVEWTEADITTVVLPEAEYDLWHDRAVFHFLTDPADRERYRTTVLRALKRGGHLILATFALDGPPECSGLPVIHYDGRSLLQEFGDQFELLDSVPETHPTPFGTSQQFVYCHLRRRS